MSLGDFRDTELGTLIQELRAGWGMRVGACFLISIFFAIMAAAASQSEQAPLWLALIAVLAMGACGSTLFIMSASRVRLYQNGIERVGRFGTKRLLFSQLASYQLQIIDAAVAAGASAGLIGVLVARLIVRSMKPKEQAPNAIWLFDKSGMKLVLSGNVRGYKELAKQLVPMLDERLFAQLKPAFDSGVPLEFGKKVRLQRGVGVTVKGLFGREQALPLEQIAGATLEGALLIIRRSDTNAVWQSLQASTVSNLGVLTKLLQLAGRPYEEGVPLAWTS